MKGIFIIIALLSIAVYKSGRAQQLRDAVIIEANGTESSMVARRVLFGFLQSCTSQNQVNSSLSSFDVYSRLTRLEKLYAELNDRLRNISAVVSSIDTRSTNAPNANANQFRTMITEQEVAEKNQEAEQLNDYKKIAGMKPVFWLSGRFFNGLKPTNKTRNAELASNLENDTVGNQITQSGVTYLVEDGGKMAFHFNRSNSIASEKIVSGNFTFVAVFRLLSAFSVYEGRFFTGSEGNKYFGGHVGCVDRWYIDGWIRSQCRKSADLELLVGTNENGVKNLWNNRQLQLIVNSTDGANYWGRVVIGRPFQEAREAAEVNVFEALVFDSALASHQLSYIKDTMTKWYGIQ